MTFHSLAQEILDNHRLVGSRVMHLGDTEFERRQIPLTSLHRHVLSPNNLMTTVGPAFPSFICALLRAVSRIRNGQRRPAKSAKGGTSEIALSAVER
jgi:hypothetical protein